MPKLSQDYNLAALHPDVAMEWHPTRNGDLTAKNVTPGSNKKVWWLCAKGHEWKAVIHKRTEGHGCPYCSGRMEIKWDVKTEILLRNE